MLYSQRCVRDACATWRDYSVHTVSLLNMRQVREVSQRVLRVTKRPFEDLTALERLIQTIRLISTSLIIILGFIVIVGPINSPQALYMSRLDTFSADISQGIFSALQDNIETSGSYDINNGVGLTTSELLVLTSYSFQQVENVPQYMTISVYGMCSVRYTTADVLTAQGTIIRKRNSTETHDCLYMGPDYLFDYKEVLQAVGLNIILDYAYKQNAQTSKTNSDAKYDVFIEHMRILKEHIVKLFYSVLSFEVVIFCLTIWYYYIKGRSIDIARERIIIHVISLLSLTVAVCGYVCIISLAWINFSIQGKIKSELAAFGFSYHLGHKWFSCLWFLGFQLVVSCFVWSGLEWCASDNDGSANTDGSTLEDRILPSESFKADDLEVLASNVEGINNNNESTTLDNRTCKSSKLKMYPNLSKYRLRQGVNPSVAGDEVEDGEEFELQSIALRSSSDFEREEDSASDTEYSIRRMVVPSSTMQF